MRQLVEHEFEEIDGIPGRLPKDETLLWQGKPSWRAIAVHVFHIRLIGGYFLLLAGWRLYTGVSASQPALEMAANVTTVILMGAAVITLVSLFSYLVERTTIYSLTSKRILMRIGVALPITLNLPFSKLAAAAVKEVATNNNTGNISFDVVPEERVAWLVLWPHVRAGHIARAQPTLRLIKDVNQVASIVSDAMQTEQSARILQEGRGGDDASIRVRSVENEPAGKLNEDLPRGFVPAE